MPTDPLVTTQKTARSSLNHLWGGAHPYVESSTASIYGRLELPEHGLTDADGNDISAPGKLLEFPSPVGTEELNHFMVFTVYTGLEGALNAYNYGRYVQEEMEDAIVSGALGLATVLGGFYATSRYVKRTGKTKIRIKRYAGFVGISASLTAGLLAWSLGDNLMDLTRSEEDLEMLDNFTDWIGKMAENVNHNEGVNQNIEGQWSRGADSGSQGRVTRFGKAHFRHEDTIALYMPQKVQAMSLLEYEQQDMSFMHKLLDDWSGLAFGAAFAAIPKAADALAGIFGQNTNVQAALHGAARIAPNPRKQLMFREPVSRKFEFNFNFSPRNEKESARAYEIIQTFKKHAYPSLSEKMGQGAFYNFPAEFDIKYYTLDESGNPIENDFLNKIGRCALREINVDYASSGSFSTFENGAPSNMILSLTFEEMELLDSGLIDGYGY